MLSIAYIKHLNKKMPDIFEIGKGWSNKIQFVQILLKNKRTAILRGEYAGTSAKVSL